MLSSFLGLPTRFQLLKSSFLQQHDSRQEQSWDFKTLPARDAASLGWNRMVALIENLRRDSAGEDLDSGLANALASRKQNEMNEILQNLPDGVAVTDMEGRITFANRALTTLLNSELEADELTGKAMEERLLEELPSVIGSPLLSPDHSHRPVVSELKRSEEESSRIIRVARQPLRSKQFEGQVWSLRDVTQQKLAEKMRDQFIDTATHELRTPLSNIKAYAETLATCDSIEIEEQKEFCNIINSETTRLSKICRRLCLSISSMEGGLAFSRTTKSRNGTTFCRGRKQSPPLDAAEEY